MQNWLDNVEKLLIENKINIDEDNAYNQSRVELENDDYKGKETRDIILNGLDASQEKILDVFGGTIGNMVQKLNRYKKITELSNHNFFGEKTVTKRLKLKKKFWTVCVACYNYFIDLNEGHTTKNVQKISDYQKNSKEFQSAFQDIFKTKALDSNMRDMLEKFVEGYQRIKKLTKLTNDNISYTEFNISPSLQILSERINENYERIDNLTHMEYRLVDREATVLLHIEQVNKIRQQKLITLYSKIFPQYSDCET
jgi:hypothetical protein